MLSRREAGASAVEYGLIVVAIAAVVTAAAFFLGGTVQELFADSCDTIRAEASISATCGP